MQNDITLRKEKLEQVEETTCCIVGGGPGGAVLALLLAREGIPVILLEEHMDFDRDFRGDTIHPSVLRNYGRLLLNCCRNTLIAWITSRSGSRFLYSRSSPVACHAGIVPVCC